MSTPCRDAPARSLSLPPRSRSQPPLLSQHTRYTLDSYLATPAAAAPASDASWLAGPDVMLLLPLLLGQLLLLPRRPLEQASSRRTLAAWAPTAIGCAWQPWQEALPPALVGHTTPVVTWPTLQAQGERSPLPWLMTAGQLWGVCQPAQWVQVLAANRPTISNAGSNAVGATNGNAVRSKRGRQQQHVALCELAMQHPKAHGAAPRLLQQKEPHAASNDPAQTPSLNQQAITQLSPPPLLG